MPPAATHAVHPVDRSFWHPINLLSFITFAWAAPSKHLLKNKPPAEQVRLNSNRDPSSKDASDEYHAPPVPKSERVEEVSRGLLASRTPVAPTPDNSNELNAIDFASAVKRYSQWRFLYCTCLYVVYASTSIVQVYFLQQILQFLQDEVLGLEPSPSHAYKMAAGLVASSVVYVRLMSF
jgi:hypothetical protein